MRTDLLTLAREPLEPDALLRLAGAEGVLDAASVEGLEVLCGSAETDARLDPVGRLGLVDRIWVALSTRRVLATLPEPPPMQPPVLIVGMPRSGTTVLHHRLASHPDLRALATWEAAAPLPLDRFVDNRRMIEDRLRRLARRSPGHGSSHRVDVDQPEECLLLLEPSLRSPSFWHQFPVHGYARWLEHVEPEAAYTIYGRLLRHLAAEQPTRRLVLKAPAHAPSLDTLRAELPGVRIVWTHRDPGAVLPSLVRLHTHMHANVSRELDTARTLAFLAAHLGRYLDPPGDDDVVHVSFAELMANPTAVAEAVCEQLDLPAAPLTTTLVERAPADHPALPLPPSITEAAERYREAWL